MNIDIVPVPKPRMTRSDVWQERDCVMRYRAYCDKLRLKFKGEIPSSVMLGFQMPMPKSWSAKKQEMMFGQPHKQKPDLDNLIKGVLDALCEEDEYIHQITAMKTWGYQGSLLILEGYGQN